MLVQLGDRLLGFFIRAHLHECESAGTARGHVAHPLHRLDVAGLRKQLLQLGLAGFVRKISNIQLTTHESNSSVASATIGAAYAAHVPTVQSWTRGSISSR